MPRVGTLCSPLEDQESGDKLPRVTKHWSSMVRDGVVLYLKLGISRIICNSHHPLFISNLVGEDGPSVTPSLMCPLGVPRAVCGFSGLWEIQHFCKCLFGAMIWSLACPVCRTAWVTESSSTCTCAAAPSVLTLLCVCSSHKRQHPWWGISPK